MTGSPGWCTVAAATTGMALATDRTHDGKRPSLSIRAPDVRLPIMLRLRVLGALDATIQAGGTTEVLDLGGPRQRSVLALLLVARGQVVSVDRLIEDLWNGEPPRRAIGALQAYVSHLRRSLEPNRAPRTPAMCWSASRRAMRFDCRRRQWTPGVSKRWSARPTETADTGTERKLLQRGA